LDICTIVDPGFAPATIPSLTAASAAGSETMMMTTSARSAASAGVAARCAPRPTTAISAIEASCRNQVAFA
jgi:hypothetical protein